MIESSLLQTLIAVSKSMNFSRAAEMLGVTQSAVSQNIKNLESKVGFPIIARNKKQPVLTDEGIKLVKVAEEYFSKFDKTIAQIHEEKEQMVGEIHIGTFNGIGKSWLGPQMIQFAKQNPDLSLRVSLNYLENLLEGFHKNEINCLVLPENCLPHHVEAKVLHQEFITLVFPPDHRFPVKGDITLKELTSYPVIFFEPHDPLFYRWCKLRLGSIPRNLRPKFITNSYGQILQAVMEGLGIAVVPTHVFKRSFYKDKVAHLGKENDVANNKFFFVQHQETVETLKYQSLYKFLHDSVKDLP